mmetsp:Transcript_22904/g.25478  ORF Transcript_22904/g.25478 Transcript_22904/m.25478 type:complete len:192 (-) Transcript_22904:173-748(-)
MTEVCKVVILGDGGIGKSALMVRYVYNEFVLNYDPTLEYDDAKETEIDGNNTKIEIIDTAGREEFSAFFNQLYREGDCFLLLYSIDNKQSFEAVDDYVHKVLRARDPENEEELFPMVLVGTKSDLINGRQVSEQQGKDKAKEYNIPFFETSSKEGVNVISTFEEAVRETRRYHTKTTEPQTNKKSTRCLIM